jgi:hypothetical protein
LCFGHFWERVSCFCPSQPGLQSSYFYLQHSWNDRHAPLCPAFLICWDGVPWTFCLG